MKTVVKIFVLPLLLATCLFAQVQAQSVTALSPRTSSTLTASVKSEISAFNQAWTKDFNSANVDALTKHYTDDAVLTEADGSSFKGTDAIKKHFEQMFEAVTATITSSVVTDIVVIDAGTVQTTGTYTGDIIVKETGEKKQVSGTFATLDKKENGEWKTVRELVSEDPSTDAIKK